MFTNGGQRVEEVMTFDEQGQRSWFIGNTVQSDGTMLVTTPIDCTFLILPYLIKANKAKPGIFMSLDCLLDDLELPECRRLSSCCSPQHLDSVADIKGSGDSAVLRYNEVKTFTWLKLKVDQLIVCLQDLDVRVDASVATFVRSKRSSEINADEHKLYAVGLISEYLSPGLAQQLSDALGIKADVAVYADEESPLLKKAKLEPLAPLEDYSIHGFDFNKKPDKPKTVAQRKLNKVDKTGMKSLASFFTAKTAKK